MLRLHFPFICKTFLLPFSFDVTLTIFMPMVFYIHYVFVVIYQLPTNQITVFWHDVFNVLNFVQSLS